ncbi:unnamed protein product [Prorocentrum cordatum]|uniref:Uncharacterized protein n=1 Tax=Prorocentrum cordatum TaxID=2364126 RepID=A0ABN9X6R5_9DINO|nr:unnamed protein product [Polarella glacialis]CAK0895103.1 unnamed protein product [Polarella glacialis]
MRTPRAVCIVGAGPAGLQLGHLLLRDGSALADYVIFERSGSAGSFFERFPVHRSLISLNKRHARSRSEEFRMRHDWNSLLGSDAAGVRPVTERSDELYPHANVLVEYLREYAAEQSEHISTTAWRFGGYGRWPARGASSSAWSAAAGPRSPRAAAAWWWPRGCRLRTGPRTSSARDS